MTLPSHQQYKDSGTQWLGKVPSHWDTQRVKRLFEIKKRIVGECGFDVLSITQQGIKIKDIESNDGQLSMDYSKYQLVEVGDFAMNHMDLLTGYVDISISEGVTSPDYRVFTIKNETITDSKYFLYLFQNGYKRKIFYAFGQGASQFGRWRLPTEQFNDFLMPFPPVSEQKSIVKYLDKETTKIDALIAEQNKLVELLKEKRQGIISHAVTKGLNPKAKMKDSGVEWLGEVPEGWKVISLKHIVSIPITDGPHETPNFIDEGIPFVSAEAIGSGEINFNKIRGFISLETHEQYSTKCHPKKNDIFLIKSGATTGVSAIVETDIDFNIWSPLALIRCDKTKASPYFVLNAIRSKNFQEAITLNWSFGTQQNIGMGVIENLSIALPPLSEQIDIIKWLDPMLEKTRLLIAEAYNAVELLKERRSALISAAVTGKIDVRKAS